MIPSPSDVAAESPFVCALTHIRWHRVLITLRVSVSSREAPASRIADAHEISFDLVDGERTHSLPAMPREDGGFDLLINVTCFSRRRAVPNGTYRIQVSIDGQRGPIAEYDGRALSQLDEAARVFLYDANRSVMTVSFGIAENSDRLDFLMRVYHFDRSPARTPGFRPLARIRERLVGARSRERYARFVYSFVHRWIGPRSGRILFASDQRATIEGNLLRVQERMIERGLADQFDMQYSFRLPGTTGWLTTMRILYLMATSEIILLDDYFGLLKSVRIGRGTKVIQLWHAGSGFKSVGYSRFGNPGSPKLWHPHRQYTYAITGSEHLVPVYAEAFGIEESAVLPTGLPRVDWFLDEERTRRFVADFYAQYPQFAGKRIVLFAPTFRGRSIHDAFYDYGEIDFPALYDVCGPDTVVLFRMHHFVHEPVPIPEEHRDRFFDFTRFPDGLNLLHVTDLLITDYSSIIYEYSLLDRPMLFFAPDKVNYAATRGFHRDYDETAPGRVCGTFAEVVDAIAAEDFEQRKVALFRAENFDRIDTGSADRVIDWLILSDPHSADARAFDEDDTDSEASQEEEEEVR